MQIIIAPARKMNIDTDTFDATSAPLLLPQARTLWQTMRQLDYDQARTLWQCSDRLARPTYTILQANPEPTGATPAILAFTGLQYQQMAPDLFTQPALDYITAHLRIVSGLYGLLRPFDGILPYRLAMDTKLAVKNTSNLYAFWGAHLAKALAPSDGLIINLASAEYTRAIRPHLGATQTMVDIVFGSLVAGKIKMHATYAKMARGAMVRYMAENNVKKIAQLRDFNDYGYEFAPEQSTSTKLVFLR